MTDTPAQRRAKRAWEARERAKDPEGFKARQLDAQKRYYAKNREELTAKKRVSEHADPEATRARGRADYAKNSKARNASSARYKAANREKILAGQRAQNLKRYGLTPETKAAMFTAQGNCCACCGSTSPRTKRGWCVDHDHATGKVRGILCLYCNVALGKVQDSTEHLRALIKYLDQHNA